MHSQKGNILKQFFLFLLFFAAGMMHAQEYTIKFATIAPEGTTWMNVMREFDQAVRKESKGRLGFKIYPGMVQGDEKDVLRKISLGQLHSAGVTGNGITSIAPKVRILDTPFLVNSYDEADHLYKTFDKELNAAFEEHGYVNLGWAEVGFVYVFTNAPVAKPDEMKNVKMWIWEGDPVAEATFTALGINPIPLSINDVYTSLQTKLIDGVYSTPLGAIAFQWFTRVKYMLDLPLADAAGAVIISRKKFDELPDDLKEILSRNGKLYMRKLTELARNDKSITTLKSNGITIVDPPSREVRRSYENTGKAARRLLIGKLYSEDFCNRVEQAVADYRAGKSK
jgi:TRAP-type transport system periplasmic protein